MPEIYSMIVFYITGLEMYFHSFILTFHVLVNPFIDYMALKVWRQLWDQFINEEMYMWLDKIQVLVARGNKSTKVGLRPRRQLKSTLTKF